MEEKTGRRTTDSGREGSGQMYFPGDFPGAEWAYADAAVPDLRLEFDLRAPRPPEKGRKHPEPDQERDLEEE